jgi:hypothetical protein
MYSFLLLIMIREFYGKPISDKMHYLYLFSRVQRTGKSRIIFEHVFSKNYITPGFSYLQSHFLDFDKHTYILFDYSARPFDDPIPKNASCEIAPILIRRQHILVGDHCLFAAAREQCVYVCCRGKKPVNK